MIGSISGVSQMMGVSAIHPYGGTYQYMGYARVQAASRNMPRQSTVEGTGITGTIASAISGTNAKTAAPAVSEVGGGHRIGAVWAGN